MSTTEETRRDSYHTALQTIEGRRKIVLEILGDRQMTAHEIAEALVKKGYAPHYERNFAAPRLTELRKLGIVEVVGKRINPLTGRNIAVWAVKPQEDSNGDYQQQQAT